MATLTYNVPHFGANCVFIMSVIKLWNRNWHKRNFGLHFKRWFASLLCSWDIMRIKTFLIYILNFLVSFIPTDSFAFLILSMIERSIWNSTPGFITINMQDLNAIDPSMRGVFWWQRWMAFGTFFNGNKNLHQRRLKDSLSCKGILIPTTPQ